MRKFSFILLFTLSWLASDLLGQPSAAGIGRDGYGHPVVFEFKSNYLTYLGYYTWNRHDRQFDNRAMIEEYIQVINHNLSDIQTGKTKVHVRGYFISRATEAENLAAAKHSSNEVKSWFITHGDLKEEYYQTQNFASSFNEEGYDAVVLFLGPVDSDTPPMPACVVVFMDGKPIAAGDGISDITPVRGNLAFRYPVIPGTYINETGSAYANTTESTSNVAGEKGGNALVGGTTVAEAGSGETASYTPPANPIKKSEIQNTGSDTPPAIHNSYTRPSGGAPARKSNQVAIRTDEAAPTTVEHIPFGSAAYSAGSKSKGGTAGGGNGNNSDQKDKDLKRKNSPAPPPGPIRSGNQQGNAPAVRQPLQGSTTYTAPVPQNGKKKKDPVKADRASAGRNEKGKVSEKGRADNAMTVVMSKDKSVKPTAGKREEPKGAAVNNSNSNQEQTKDGAGSTAGRSKQLALDPEGTRLDGNNEYVGFGPVGTPYQKGKSPDQPGLSKTPRKPMVYREIYPVFGIKTDIIPWVGLQANDFKMYSFVPNIEAEFFFAQRFSVAGQGEYMKRPQRDDKYFGRSAWSLEPRVWIKGDSRFRWAYVGLYGEVGDFDNIANYLPKDTGKTGFFFGGGIAAGVYIPIQPRFGIEVGARAGFTQWEVDDYSYEAPIYYLDERNKFGTWGLTEVKVSLSYRFGKSFAGKPPRRIIR